MEFKKKDIIYKKFSDGLEFVPDIGRSRTLGEVFTPYVVVRKMISMCGIKKAKSNATVMEPASGHGNFGVEILCYKLKSVCKEMKKEKIKEEEWTKEYEIRSLLAVGSLYSNDIDKQNIEELKGRYTRYIVNCYKKYSKNLRGEIPVHYDIAIANILDCNCILADFIGKKSEEIKFCFYFREKGSENIYRVVQTLKQLRKKENGKQLSLFEKNEEKMFLWADKIKYEDWENLIDKQYNLSTEQPR